MGLQNLSSECKDVSSLPCEKLILRWNRVFLSLFSKLAKIANFHECMDYSDSNELKTFGEGFCHSEETTMSMQNTMAEQIMHYENINDLPSYILLFLEFMFKMMFFQQLISLHRFRTVIKCSFTVGEV